MYHFYNCSSIIGTMFGTTRRLDQISKIYLMKALMFVECSRLSCTKRKELDDMVKLWRETNDGLYWARKGCKPEKEQFGIVGIQVAGKIISLYFPRSIFHEIFL